MAKEDVYIKFILDELDNKNVDRAIVLAKFVKKWQVSDRTFDRYWKTANERHTEAVRALELERQGLLSESLKDEIQAQILTETEIDLILSKIVTGDIKVEEYIKGEPVIRDISPSDIIAAADKLYKRKGSYAPTKLANTTASGDDVNQITISMPAGFILDFPSNTDESTT